jgi:hypothetical protein
LSEVTVFINNTISAMSSWVPIEGGAACARK